ncbi:ABC transporter permease [Phytomonospora endophytica]|uniref:ABC-type transport system involved in multi-copper enzyme maturation permease subunit n=1 Tax=Phytomonospora endophytica TaxID=714109 RepID=A0A841FG65_9ACTN|nr:ABC transporter permease [Phytomonospora endophytica]MBB6036321.1 ABC-type transport system involved in multi-copper enzyme maturation permease subunit [Phytomonospora endophytica]GIG67228.1 ABC transporter permease [Phytomonospora endophytica]
MIRSELRRLLATRLSWAIVLAPAAIGLGLVGLMALTGPENFQPPMPGLDTADGVRLLLGVLGLSAFVPAAIGTLAMTAEYRHRTIDATFLHSPRRGRVLGAKLVVHAGAGVVYGLILAVTSAVSLYGAAAVRGTELGLPPGEVLGVLAGIGAAMAVYLVIGVGVGAVLHHQIAALAVVVGYLYAGETALLMIPGVNGAYPLLPGGATSALTRFTYISDSLSEQLGTTAVSLLSPLLGAVVLLGYAALAAGAAMLAPMRRDVV